MSPFIQACPDPHDCSSESAAFDAASAALISAADRLDIARSRLDAARSEFDRLSGERDIALSDHRAVLARWDRHRSELARARRDSGIAVAGVIGTLVAVEIGGAFVIVAIGSAAYYIAIEDTLRAALVADGAAIIDTRARYDSARRAVWPAERELSTATSLFDSARATYDAARAAYDRAIAAYSSCSSS
jgi:hypothetical protein